MADTVTVTTAVSYKCFQVPKFVRQDMPPRPRQEGIHELPAIPLEELGPGVLDALASTWLDQLYASVGKPSPFKLSATPAAPHMGGETL